MWRRIQCGLQRWETRNHFNDIDGSRPMKSAICALQIRETVQGKRFAHGWVLQAKMVGFGTLVRADRDSLSPLFRDRDSAASLRRDHDASDISADRIWSSYDPGQLVSRHTRISRFVEFWPQGW